MLQIEHALLGSLLSIDHLGHLSDQKASKIYREHEVAVSCVTPIWHDRESPGRQPRERISQNKVFYRWSALGYRSASLPAKIVTQLEAKVHLVNEKYPCLVEITSVQPSAPIPDSISALLVVTAILRKRSLRRVCLPQQLLRGVLDA